MVERGGPLRTQVVKNDYADTILPIAVRKVEPSVRCLQAAQAPWLQSRQGEPSQEERGRGDVHTDTIEGFGRISSLPSAPGANGQARSRYLGKVTGRPRRF